MQSLRARSIMWRLCASCVGTHLAAARIAAGPVPLRDLAMELSLVASALLLVLSAERVLGDNSRVWLVAFPSVVVLGAVGPGTLLHFGFGTELGWGRGVTAGVCIVAWALLSAALIWRRPGWLAAAYPLFFGLALCLGWSQRPPFPSAAALWGALGMLSLGGALLALRPRSGAAFSVACVLFCLLPGEARPVAAPAWSQGGPAPDGPDVFVVIADTLRNDVSRTLGIHRALVAQGRDLGPAVATSSWTLPAVTSLMTGQPVAAHSAGRHGKGTTTALRQEIPTLAERLGQAGYDTAAVLALNPYVSETYGLHRGFDVHDYQGSHTRGADPFPGVPGVGRPALSYFLHRIAHRTKSLPLRRLLQPLPLADDAFAVLGRAKQILAQRRDRPLFMWVHLMDVHAPYTHAHELDLPPWALGRIDHLIHSAVAPPWMAEPQTQQVFHQVYRHEAGRMDRALSSFLQALGPVPARGRLIVFTSDHGEEFGEHLGIGHGHAFWEEVVGVPLVVAGVETRAPDVRGPASQLDVVPTILRAAGLSHSDLPGHPLQSSLAPRRLRSENTYFRDGQKHALREGALKLIAAKDTNQLFDLSLDPGEQQDVCSRFSDQCQALIRDEAAPVRAGQAPQVTEAERRALRALGYVE